MTLIAGSQLGRYEIRSQLGAGGMGEVYRARDEKLNRDVAIKVLPATLSQNADRLRRFEQEAQAAGALNHPNILAVYDVGTHDGAPYVVSELLEGESLKERLSDGPLAQRKTIDYGVQIAHGLAAVHGKGIVHRDLKPDNIFITKDGRVKILDFGIAKLTESSGSEAQTDVPTRKVKTDPGAVMGTVGYMSPEQVRGRAVDHRSDIFSFGAVLYEMLSGKRAFHGDSAADTIGAILKEDPPDLSETNTNISPTLERVVRRCLEKNPAERFQSASDLAFGLENVSGISGQSTTETLTSAPLSAKRRARLVMMIPALVVVAVAALTGAFFIGRRSSTTTPPVYHKLTFRRGTIWNARFAPDGQTVVYSASWNGTLIDIFTTRAGSTESRSLGLQNADVLAVSSSGEMAVLLNRHYQYQLIARGTLARVPLTGGAPREVLEDVQQADWSPDGANLAVVRWVDGRNRLEYPIGRVLYETSGYISNPRVSPKGDMVAFMDHQIVGDDRGWVAVVDANGQKKTLSSEQEGEEGLAWSAPGDEIWFGGDPNYSIKAVTLAAQERVVAPAPTYTWLGDISRDGHTLFTSLNIEVDVIGLPPGETKERDLSWLGNIALNDLSADGKTFIVTYYGEGSGTNYLVYLRKTDGSPGVRLGQGQAYAFSPDGKRVLASTRQPPQLVLLPTGAGEVKRIERAGIEYYDWANWLPDGKRIVFSGREPGHSLRLYVQDIEGGSPRAIGPEGVSIEGYTSFTTSGFLPVSPDGQSFIGRSSNTNLIFSIAGGAARPVPGLGQEDHVIRWSADGGSLFVMQGTSPLKVFRHDLSTGRRELWKEITPTDPAGVLVISLFPTPDGKGYVYQIQRFLHELYVAEGLK